MLPEWLGAKTYTVEKRTMEKQSDANTPQKAIALTASLELYKLQI